MFILVMLENNIATAKGINHIGHLFKNEIEITEEQYTQINDFPLKLTIVDGQVTSWEKTVLSVEDWVEPVYIPTETELIMLAIAELDAQREIDKTETEMAIAELAETLLIGGAV